MPTKNRKRAFILILFLVAIGLGFAAGSAEAFPNPLKFFGWSAAEPTPAPAAPAPASAPMRPAVGVPDSFAPIAHAARPAVVNVATTQTVRTQGFPGFGPGQQQPFSQQDPFFQFFRHFFGPMPRSFTQRALGSGVIIDKDGYIVTNAHVVKGADKIVVTLHDGHEHGRAVDAKVVGVDEKTDVALLKIPSSGDLPVATLGDSDAIHVGDWVVAIGNPFGLSETVTAGIVSAKGRVIGQGPYDDFIQTDASINPGNSGGPLLNLQDQVIGINSAIYSQSGGNIGIGFAIPINLVKSVVAQLKAHGKVIRGWLGVAIQDITPDLAKSFGLKQAEGALVADVTPDSPAARAGVERGDIIVKYNGTHIAAAHQLPELVAGTEIGKAVPIEVLRNGEPKTLSVTIAEMPAHMAAAGSAPAAGDWGLTVSDITPNLAHRFGLKEGAGVVVTEVDPNSPAGAAGLQPGDVIVEADRKPVHNVTEYDQALAHATNQVLFLVDRQGQRFFVALSRSQ
jgi:serine protease Do